MGKFLFSLFFFLLTTGSSFAQSSESPKVFTSDIDNFWIAYDSAQTVKDSSQKLDIFQRLYIEKGTEGLKAFMKLRNYSVELWVKLIIKYPKFWNSIRPNTLSVESKSAEIEKSINKFKILYPELKESKMYFTVGGLRSGGTTTENMVLIGTEIATGNPSTNVSEFNSKWLAGVFKEQSQDNIVPLNIHEYVHTQQKGESHNLLAQSITEGSCDFITELVIEKPMLTNYIKYGLEHEKDLKEKFKQDMFTTSFNRWLYNGPNAETVADLGYFMGYQICKSYYTNATDKKQAIKEIIELNYSDTTAVEAFLQKSKYFKETINKKKLMAAFKRQQPAIVKIEPFVTTDSVIDASIKEITVFFSKPMKSFYSINLGEGGKETYPITGINGYSTDMKSLKIKIDLKPNSKYEFVLTDISFASADSYPIDEYHVRFKTK